MSRLLKFCLPVFAIAIVVATSTKAAPDAKISPTAANAVNIEVAQNAIHNEGAAQNAEAAYNSNLTTGNAVNDAEANVAGVAMKKEAIAFQAGGANGGHFVSGDAPNQQYLS